MEFSYLFPVFYLILCIGVTLLFLKQLVIPMFLRKGKGNRKGSSQSVDTPFVSVVVAFRNEEKNLQYLLTCLDEQEYPNFEVILVNDHSTDGSFLLAQEFIAGKKRFDLYTADERYSGKKYALDKGIRACKGDIIVTTDADCIVSEKWISSIVDVYASDHQVKMVAGPVVFQPVNNLFEKMQQVEFASLIFSSALGIYNEKPQMANGANLSFSKQVFEQVGGYQDNFYIHSGDDEFLLHKVSKIPNVKIAYNFSLEGLVHTLPSNSFQEFYWQRRRWASKWKYYKNGTSKYLAVLVWLMNFVWIGLIMLSFFDILFLQYLLLKITGELFLLGTFLITFRQLKNLWVIPFVSLIHPFYVVFFGLLGFKKGFVWKKRYVGDDQ